MLPYKELEQTVHQVFSEHPKKDRLKINICSTAPRKLESLPFRGDAIIARGFTAKVLKEYNLPHIEIPVTGYDIIRAVNKCTSHHKTKKIACIGSLNMVYGLQSIKEILDVELDSYHVENEAELAEQIQNALQAGAEAIIGGLTVNRMAQALGVPSTIIEVGKEAVHQVLDEAIRAVDLTRLERARTERFKLLMDYAYEGIIAIDSSGTITTFNQRAQDITRIDGEKCIGRHIDAVLPDINLSQTLRSGKSELGNIFTINNVTIVANLVPIVVEQRTAGAIVTFDNIAKIQEVEGHIRKKTHEKGLVAKYHFDNIIGQSPAIVETIRFAQKYSKVNSNILLVGETGTGKELFAQSIHNTSSRKEKPFVAVNCAAIPEPLLESELFGYAEGAFTGAARGGKQGYFELAHGGTLFLDEISELSPNLQGRLLRVLQENEVMPLGANKVIPVNVRILSATNKNLPKLVASGLFRQDLFYRLDVLRLFLPPLRGRKEDIPTLIQHFIEKNRRKLGGPKFRIFPEVIQMLTEYPWPGNVRELKNYCERLVILVEEETVDLGTARKIIDFDGYFSADPAGVISSPAAASAPSIGESEAAAIRTTLLQVGNDKSLAAKLLGVHPTTLWRKMRKHGLL
ncbi:MAG: sigma 54-interacting transcriptional regulator [Negativicutes bacterium]|nr:sigma 54-interacting transcriptional regulator [Negativicutes bacterium]